MAFEPKYKEILTTKLGTLIEKVEVKNGWIEVDSVYSNNEEFGSEADKKLEVHLGKWGTSSIILDFCTKNLPEVKDRQSLNGKLLDVTENKKEEIVESILNYLEGFPYNYEVFVDMGKGLKEHFEELEVIEGIKIKNFNGDETYLNDDKDKRKARLFFDEPTLYKDKCYLVLTQSGHFSNDLTKKTVIDTYSKLKKILYIGHSTGTIIENKRFLAFYRRGRSDLVYRNLEFEPDRIFKLESTSDLAEYSHKLTFNPELKEKKKMGLLSGLLGNKDESDEPEFYNWKESNDEFLSLCKKLLSPNVDSIKVEPVNRAIEWAFNALYTQDVNLAFIQSCMALEAILGDNLSSKKALHETLADRFAYSIGTNNANRRTHRKNFLEIYDMRSKIVHGSSTHIQHDKIYLSNWANKVLEYLIKKEIKNL
jgi:hypothetical protein